MKFSKGYLAKEKMEYAKGGSENTKHEGVESKRKELAERKAMKKMGGKR